MCPRSLTTCASTATSWIMICWLALIGNFALPSAPPSAVICLITPGGKQPQGFLWRTWPSHRHWGGPTGLNGQQHHVSSSGHLIDHFSTAFGTPSQPILAEYDTRTDEALSRVAERELWRNVLTGTEDAMRDLPTPLCSTLVASLPMTATETTSTFLRASARRSWASSFSALTRTSLETDELHTRLAELGTVDVGHPPRRLTFHHALTLEPEEYVDSVRMRLGCAVSTEPVASAAASLASWARALLTPLAVPLARLHVSTTRSHPHAVAQSCGHTAGMEVLGLILGTDPHLGPRHRTGHLDPLTAHPADWPKLHPFQAGCQARHLPSLLHQNTSYTPDSSECLWETPPGHQLRQLAAQPASSASLEETLAHGFHCWFRFWPSRCWTTCSLLRAHVLALSRALPCPSALRSGVDRFCSARAALPLAWQSSVVPSLRQSSSASPPSKEAADSASTVCASSLLTTVTHTQTGKTFHVARDPASSPPPVRHVACYDDTSSDEDEYNTSNPLLLLCAHALVAPALLFGLTELDE